MNFFAAGVQMLQALVDQLLDHLTRNVQFATNPLFGDVQGQPLEGFKKALRVLLQAAQLDAQVTDQLTVFLPFGLVLFTGKRQAFLDALFARFLLQGGDGCLTPCGGVFGGLGFGIGRQDLIGGCVRTVRLRWGRCVVGTRRHRKSAGGLTHGRIDRCGHTPGAETAGRGLVPLGAQEMRHLLAVGEQGVRLPDLGFGVDGEWIRQSRLRCLPAPVRLLPTACVPDA